MFRIWWVSLSIWQVLDFVLTLSRPTWVSTRDKTLPLVGGIRQNLWSWAFRTMQLVGECRKKAAGFQGITCVLGNEDIFGSLGHVLSMYVQVLQLSPFAQTGLLISLRILACNRTCPSTQFCSFLTFLYIREVFILGLPMCQRIWVFCSSYYVQPIILSPTRVQWPHNAGMDSILFVYYNVCFSPLDTDLIHGPPAPCHHLGYPFSCTLHAGKPSINLQSCNQWGF